MSLINDTDYKWAPYLYLEEIQNKLKIPKELLHFDGNSELGSSSTKGMPAQQFYDTNTVFIRQFLNIFGHTSSSPANGVKFKRIYSWPKLYNSDNHISSKIINRSEKAAAEFTDDIIKASELNNSQYENLFLLKGARGSGKTYFINYITSFLTNKFKITDTLWVRVNLSRIYQGWTVFERFQHQFCIIVRDKYFLDKKSKVCWNDFKKFLVLEGYSAEEINIVIVKIATMKDLNIESEVSNTVQVVPLETQVTNGLEKTCLIMNEQRVSDIIYKFMQNINYSFVFFLDGLDVLEPTSDCKEIFEEWMSSAEILVGSDAYQCSWVLSTRNETYDLLVTNSYKTRFPRIANISEKRTFYVYSPSPHEVLKRRIKFASSIARKNKIHDGKNHSLYYYNFYLLLVGFIEHGINPKNRLNIDLNTLLSLYNYNMRRLMLTIEQGISLLFHCIGQLHGTENYLTKEEWFVIDHKLKTLLSSFPLDNWDEATNIIKRIRKNEIGSDAWKSIIRSNKYRVMSLLCNGYFHFHYDSFNYEYRDEKLIVSLNTSYGKGSGSMPNLFMVAKKTLNEDQFDLGLHLFTNISLLLYLKEQLHDTGEFKYISEQNMLTELSKLGFDRTALCVAIHYLGYYGCIATNYVNNDGHFIALTKTGLFCIETLVSDSNYCANIMNSVYLPTQFLKSQYIYDFQNKKKSNFERHYSSSVLAKHTVNRVTFIIFLHQLWLVHKVKYNKLQEGEKIVENIQTLFAKLSSGILKEISNISSDADKRKDVQFSTELITQAKKIHALLEEN